MADSTFGERFAFARWYETGRVRNETDAEFGEAIYRSKGAVSQWRKSEIPPPQPICAAIAERTGVDLGWLMAGEKSHAPEPEGFARWLATYRGEGKWQPTQHHGNPITKTAAKKGGRKTG